MFGFSSTYICKTRDCLPKIAKNKQQDRWTFPGFPKTGPNPIATRPPAGGGRNRDPVVSLSIKLVLSTHVLIRLCGIFPKYSSVINLIILLKERNNDKRGMVYHW